MISSKTLKIWTILTHALIVVGFGHGMITFGLIEIFWFPYFTKSGFSLSFNSSFEASISTVGLTTFVGQCFLIYSILAKRNSIKVAAHISGLIILWLSILYLVDGMGNNHSIHFGTISAIPFAFCTFIAFAGKPIKNLYYRVLDI